MALRYPRSIADEVESIRAAVALWPADLSVDLDDVIDWVLQFDEPDFPLAIRIVKNLCVVGQKDIDRGLRIAFSKLARKAIEKNSRISGRNTLYAGLGDVGKSGAMIGYHFRMNTGVSEENFLTDESFEYIKKGVVENIVLLDDVIGTGSQASKEIDRLAENVIPLGVKNIFVLTVCGMRDGIQRIEENTKAYTFSAFEFGVQDTVSSLDSAFYDGVSYDDRSKLQERLKSYGQIAYQKQPLGYGGIGGLLAFPYNTPNSTVPVVWSDSNDWVPLFRRVRRVNGIAAYHSQFRKAADRRAETKDTPADAAESGVTLFVEGKRDEVFFEELSRKIELPQKLGVSEVHVVSLGSNVASDRLAKLLAQTTAKPVFILDDDHPSSAKFHAKFEGSAPTIKLKPSFFKLIDLDAVVAHLLPNASPELVERLGSQPTEQVAQDLERIVLRSGSLERSVRVIRLLVAECLDESEVSKFVEELKAAASGQGKPS